MNNKLKFLVVAFLATSMIFTGCKKDENSSDDSMIGTWTLSEAKTPAGTLEFLVLKGMGISASIEFKNDTDCAVKLKLGKNVDEVSAPGTWKREGDNVKLELKEAIQALSGNDNTITLTKEGEFYTTSVSISSLNATATAKFKKD